jgi:hypothetical protein
MASELNLTSLSDFAKLADVLWMESYDSVPKVMRESGLFKVVNIPANSGNTREFSEIDGEEYAKLKEEDDQAERAKVQQGYTKTMYAQRFAHNIGISYEMRTQNKYPEVVARLTNLARQVANRMELDMAHRITFGTATTYTSMDGSTVDISTGDSLQLFYSAHTLRGSSTTYRNRLANNPRVSKGALEGMERLIAEETLNQFGEKKVIPFNIIFSGDDANTQNTIKEYLQSNADVEGSNSEVINVYKSKYKYVICPLIATTAVGATDTTKRYYWGIASSQYSTAYLGIWEEPHLKKPADMNNGEDFSTDAWEFGGRGGWGLCTVSAAWIKFSSGDGAA